MDELLSKDFNSLIEAKGGPMVSLYISREQGMLDTRQLNEKWREALFRVEDILLKIHTRTYIKNFLEPLYHQNLLAECETIDRGLIVFYSAHFQAYVRVQSDISDLVIVADTFHVKPLLRIKNHEKGFILVTVSLKQISVFAELNGRLSKMKDIDNPALEIDVDSDTNKYPRQSNHEFFSHVAIEVNRLINGMKMPILLAGVKDHVGHMKKYMNNPFVLDQFIFGSVERIKINELRYKAYQYILPYYHKKDREDVEEFYKALKQKDVVTFIEDIAVSAVAGKVKKLFVVENRQIWGRVNKKTGDVFISTQQNNAKEDDVLDDICQIVLLKHGEVVVLQDAEDVKGYVAAAIVSDRSHLYHYDRAGV